MRAKRDLCEKACSSSFRENNDENLKVIDVSPIESLFSNINLDKDGTGDESTLVKRRPNDSEFLVEMNPLFWISRNLIMIIFL